MQLLEYPRLHCHGEQHIVSKIAPTTCEDETRLRNFSHEKHGREFEGGYTSSVGIICAYNAEYRGYVICRQSRRVVTYRR